MEWFDEALCKKKHKDLWYPPMDAPKPEHRLYNDVAKLVCDQCPVRSDCELYSMTSFGGKPEEWGTWGGVTQSERRKGLPYKAPRRTLTPYQLRYGIPVHDPAVTIDIKPLRADLLAGAIKKKPGTP